jgi:sterol-4alpha-carboxylate 3-dehydrogenase (decarboxylating)
MSTESKWCAVTGGRGFMARHLVAALLRSGEWCVRITDLAPEATLDDAEKEGLLGAALRDGRAVYASTDVCDLAQLTRGSLFMSIIQSRAKLSGQI